MTTQTTRRRACTSRASRPQSPLVSVCSEPYIGRNGQNAHRPSSSSAAGSRVSELSIAPAMPIAPTGPSPLSEARSESSRQSSPRITVSPGGDDRLEGTPVGDPHRVVLRLVVAQLLAEPGHDQQRVVGGGAHREDEQDALGLAVERQHVAAGQAVDRGRGHPQRQDRGEHARRAAGSASGRPAAGSAAPPTARRPAARRRWRRRRRRSHPARRPGRRPARSARRAGRRAPPACPRRRVTISSPSVRRRPGRRPAPPRRPPTGSAAADPARRRRCSTSASSLGVVRDRLLVLGRQAAGALEDRPWSAASPRPGSSTRVVEHLGRLGALRQERRVVVLLHLGEPAGERAERPADEQPQQHHEQRPHPETSRVPPHHGRSVADAVRRRPRRARVAVSAAAGGCPGSSG